jgi:deazaflavin-dependent oxidoreductase (nitroreductase family)
VALAVFRLPLRLYHYGGGWLLGHTFLVVTHIGRRTGEPHETAAMVLRYDRASGEAVICSAWGPKTDWIRNLRVRPAVEVRLGRESFTPQQRFLTDEAAFAVAVEFGRRHPLRLRCVSWVLGWGDLRSDTALRTFVSTHPFVSFQSTGRHYTLKRHV